MTDALVRRALELLAADGPIVVAPASLAGTVVRHAPLAGDGEPGAGAVCSFLGERADPALRAARLDALAARLPAGAPIVIVDHNQPRRWWGRIVATVFLLARGLGLGRGHHETAREVHARGFVVTALRLARGERVQLVLARRRG